MVAVLQFCAAPKLVIATSSFDSLMFSNVNTDLSFVFVFRCFLLVCLSCLLFFVGRSFWCLMFFLLVRFWFVVPGKITFLGHGERNGDCEGRSAKEVEVTQLGAFFVSSRFQRPSSALSKTDLRDCRAKKPPRDDSALS